MMSATDDVIDRPLPNIILDRALLSGCSAVCCQTCCVAMIRNAATILFRLMTCQWNQHICFEQASKRPRNNSTMGQSNSGPTYPQTPSGYPQQPMNDPSSMAPSQLPYPQPVNTYPPPHHPGELERPNIDQFFVAFYHITFVDRVVWLKVMQLK